MTVELLRIVADDARRAIPDGGPDDLWVAAGQRWAKAVAELQAAQRAQRNAHNRASFRRDHPLMDADHQDHERHDGLYA